MEFLPPSLYTVNITTVDNNFTPEIELNWEFQSSFIIALMVVGPTVEGGDDAIGLSIDQNSIPVLIHGQIWVDGHPGEMLQSNTSVSDGEFGIQAKVTSAGGSVPVFNVYRDPGIDGSSFQLMFNGNGISSTTYTDNLVSNGTQYCYTVASVYDEEISDQTSQCGLPISNTVYEVAYDDGSHEDINPVGQNNFATRFIPNGYPTDLYSASFTGSKCPIRYCFIVRMG